MLDRSDSILIDRPVDDVFAYVADVTNDPAWHTDILEARKTTEDPVGMGTVWHTRFKPSMDISEADMAVVSFEPNRLLAMKGDVGPMHPTLTYRFEPADGGGDETLPFAWTFAQLSLRVSVRLKTRASCRESLSGAK
jgi:uncharacterized protein YndB with AHSA1/START domain